MGRRPRFTFLMAVDVALRPLLTKHKVCGLLRASPHTVDRLVAAGVLTAVRLVPRGRHRFRVEGVEALIAAGQP